MWDNHDWPSGIATTASTKHELTSLTPLLFLVQVLLHHPGIKNLNYSHRFCCANQKLEQRWGLLGVMRLTDPKYSETMKWPSHDANALQRATVLIIAKLATPLADAPHTAKGGTELDEAFIALNIYFIYVY